jgi:hypothetical protein
MKKTTTESNIFVTKSRRRSVNSESEVSLSYESLNTHDFNIYIGTKIIRAKAIMIIIVLSNLLLNIAILYLSLKID